MKFTRKAQLSVETMIVYGLVILAALSVIGGLLYFGILDVGSYLPDKCDVGGTDDLNCEEYSIDGNTMEFGIRNSAQRPIESLTVTVTDQTSSLFTGDATTTTTTVDGTVIGTGNTLGSGEIAAVTLTVPTAIERGEVVRGDMVVEYRYQDGAITQSSAGEIRIRAS